MTDNDRGPYEGIDALVSRARAPQAPLPPAERRRALREALGLSQAETARTLNISAATLRAWEAGTREPQDAVRDRYAYFLDAAQAALEETTPAPAPTAPDSEQLPEPQPCVLCGAPAVHQVEGFPQHLNPEECAAPAPAPVPAPEPVRAPEPAPAAPKKPTAKRPPAKGRPIEPRGRRAQAQAPALIASAVQAALTEHQGDAEAATAALVRKAIPDAMALLDSTRIGGRYDVVAHPWVPDMLRKATAKGADQVWEARPKWTRPELPAGTHEVTALDVNGAYLSALKTYLPLGQLVHDDSGQHDRRRAGIHLITPPAWDHGHELPNPIGNRDMEGPVWVTEPTLRLLLRLSGPTHALCAAPEIHESWTSGSTEGLLEKFRIILKDARDKAIQEDDTVTLEYVKAMYSKFVSTMGESNYNRALYRPDWMHLIRSQAFSNLWMKTLKFHQAGLKVVRAMGTDEIHVSGDDWRRVFPEGRGVTELKVKDAYTIGD